MSSKKGHSHDGSKYNRRFSEALKRQIVDQLITKQFTMAAISRQYQVSRASLYKWIYLYSDRVKNTRTVVEKQSQEFQNERLLARVAELERIVGQKQIEIDILRTTLEKASEELGLEDLKKKCATTLSSTSKTITK